MTDHVCAKCGKRLDPINWWTASVRDRYGGQSYKLCKLCAESMNFAMQSIISTRGEVGGSDGQMTDNRTTELLREGLTRHGIEWRSGLEGVTFVGDWCFVEYDNGKLAATCEPVLTPEQAIAATTVDGLSGEPIPNGCAINGAC